MYFIKYFLCNFHDDTFQYFGIIKSFSLKIRNQKPYDCVNAWFLIFTQNQLSEFAMPSICSFINRWRSETSLKNQLRYAGRVISSCSCRQWLGVLVLRNVYYTVCPVQWAIISDRTWASDVTFKIEHSHINSVLIVQSMTNMMQVVRNESTWFID